MNLKDFLKSKGYKLNDSIKNKTIREMILLFLEFKEQENGTGISK